MRRRPPDPRPWPSRPPPGSPPPRVRTPVRLVLRPQPGQEYGGQGGEFDMVRPPANDDEGRLCFGGLLHAAMLRPRTREALADGRCGGADGVGGASGWVGWLGGGPAPARPAGRRPSRAGTRLGAEEGAAAAGAGRESAVRSGEGSARRGAARVCGEGRAGTSPPSTGRPGRRAGRAGARRGRLGGGRWVRSRAGERRGGRGWPGRGAGAGRCAAAGGRAGRAGALARARVGSAGVVGPQWPWAGAAGRQGVLGCSAVAVGRCRGLSGVPGDRGVREW